MKTNLFNFKITKKLNPPLSLYISYETALKHVELITKEDYLYNPFFRTLQIHELATLINFNDKFVYNDLNGSSSKMKAQLLIDYYEKTK